MASLSSALKETDKAGLYSSKGAAFSAPRSGRLRPK